MLKKSLGIVFLFLIDIVSVFIVVKGAILIRKIILPEYFGFIELDPSQTDITFFWWVFPIWIFFYIYEGLYIKRLSYWDELKKLWKVAFFSTLAVFSILYLGKVGEQVSRPIIVLMGIISMIILPIVRPNAKKLLMASGLVKSKVLILGAGRTGELIFNALKRDRNFGLEVVGFLDDDRKKIGGRIGGIKIHAGVDKAQKYIGRCGIEGIVIAMPGCNRDRLISLINNLQHKTRNILLIPDLFGISVFGTNLQHFFQEQAIGLEVKNNLAETGNIIIKKIFDITASLFLLVIFLVPIIIISILIRIGSKGPAIYSQERRGKNDKTFRCYKFRTMYHDADIKLEELLKTDERAMTEWNSHWKLSNDPRITPIGRFLRQTSLDELPQIFNVLKGDMSLVGPRPVTKKEIDYYYRDQAGLCFCVPPGLTGLWQVSGRSNTSYEYRIALDSWYVRNWNLWLDIVILFKTVRVVLKREGAV